MKTFCTVFNAVPASDPRQPRTCLGANGKMTQHRDLEDAAEALHAGLPMLKRLMRAAGRPSSHPQTQLATAGNPV